MPTIDIHTGGATTYDRAPNFCPQCHHALRPSLLKGTINTDTVNNDTILEIAWQCTVRDCRSMFIGRYQRGVNQTFFLKNTAPIKHKPPKISPEVREISPSFSVIYEQASAAEGYGLGEICGVGYRKALEFLIKDFCIYTKPEEEEKITSAFLGTVIKEHVDDANLKVCAERATWLGNDETHYVRKWGDKDINDLKTLITLSCGWIQSNILTKKYLTEMA